MSQLLVSATHKSSGKTIVTLGLCAALKHRGLVVQPFKKGPDYIDPMWLSQAAGRACHNLDFYTQTPDEVLATVAQHAAQADIAVIEGNKGLYDGLDLDGTNSNAALAKQLSSPVILVLDTRGTIRGVAPLLLGYQAFDPEVRIAGVVLNQVAGVRHERKLREVLLRYTDMPLLGVVPCSPELALVERHLGLMPSNEDTEAAAEIDAIRGVIGQRLDLDAVLAIAQTAPAAMSVPVTTASGLHVAPDLRIGILRDAAFGFYYAGDLELLARHGAELVSIDALRDTHLPGLDGLFIGGGFPETHMVALEANQALRHEIYTAIDAGLPAYAECGGLMYLARSLRWGDRTCEMVGIIPGEIVMHERPQGRGYIQLEETGDGLWPASGQGAIAAHEFHYSSLENLTGAVRYAYRMRRGNGVDGEHDGIVYKNLLACYAHLRDTQQCHWTERFVGFIRAHKRASQATIPASNPT